MTRKIDAERLRAAAERVYGAAFTDQSQPRRCFVATDAIEELGDVLYYGEREEGSEQEERSGAVLKDGPEQAARYKQQMDLLVLAARIVGDADLEWLQKTVERAHSVVPVLDPTAYRNGLEELKTQERFLKAARPLWEEVRKMREEASL